MKANREKHRKQRNSSRAQDQRLQGYQQYQQPAQYQPAPHPFNKPISQYPASQEQGQYPQSVMSLGDKNVPYLSSSAASIKTIGVPSIYSQADSLNSVDTLKGSNTSMFQQNGLESQPNYNHEPRIEPLAEQVAKPPPSATTVQSSYQNDPTLQYRTQNAQFSIHVPHNSGPLTSSHRSGSHRPSSIYSFADSTYRLPSAYKPTERSLESIPASNNHTPATTTTATANGANSTNSNKKAHSIQAWTEGREPLRTIFLPANLREGFLKIAKSNTLQDLETCGMLCGVLSRNAFFVTHLLIPHQKSTPDTCQTTHEEYFFEYLDQHNLVLIGWIHTHPTQSCFMSSVDLHTQSSYQLMLKESIAIVCAPQSDPSWDIFRLTDPKGVDVIKKCTKTRFHPHPESNLYGSSMQHGHVTIADSLPYKVVDLRSVDPE